MTFNVKKNTLTDKIFNLQLTGNAPRYIRRLSSFFWIIIELDKSNYHESYLAFLKKRYFSLDLLRWSVHKCFLGDPKCLALLHKLTYWQLHKKKKKRFWNTILFSHNLWVQFLLRFYCLTSWDFDLSYGRLNLFTNKLCIYFKG